MSFLPAIKIPNRPLSTGHSTGVQISKKLVESAREETSIVLAQLDTTPNGLSQEVVEARLEQYGPNEVAREKPRTWLMRLWDNIKNPLVILLIILGAISFLTGDMRATIVILTMVILGIVLRYV
jgi:Mg2+-importing ATPase